MLVVIPAFNEAGIIGEVIGQIRSQIADRHQILVVDDGSSDNTAAEAKAAGARVISLVQNLGYGFALQTGYQVAIDEGFEVVLQLDGDGQHSPISIPTVLAPVLSGDADVVIGSRALSDTHYPMPFARRAGQAFFARVLKVMCGLEIKDPTSGYQALGKKALELYVGDDFPGDYPDTDVLLYLTLHGSRIREVPAVFKTNDRGKSMHSGILKPAYYIYKMLFSMMLVYLRHPKALRKKTSDGSPSNRGESTPSPPEAGGAGLGHRRGSLDLLPGEGPQSP